MRNGTIRFVIALGEDLTTPEAGFTKEDLEGLDYLLTIHHSENETTRMSDVVLPGVTIGAAYLMKCTDSFLMMVLLAGFVFVISGLRELKNPENAFLKKRN